MSKMIKTGMCLIEKEKGLKKNYNKRQSIGPPCKLAFKIIISAKFNHKYW